MNHFLIAIVLLFTSHLCLAEDQDVSQDEQYWVDDKLEDIISPIKQWVEKKVQPSDTPQTTPASGKNGLRLAIKQALKIYPGTVLSAQFVDNTHQIKIISEQGVVNIINIEEEVVHENSHH